MNVLNEVGKGISNIGNAIGGLLQGAGDAIGDLVNQVGKAGQQLIDGVSKLGQDIVDGVTTLITGIFGGDEETTHVATFVTRIISDKQLPNTVKFGITKGALEDVDPISFILAGYTKGISTKAEQAFRYAKKDYTFGAPTQKLFSNMTAERLIKAVAEAGLGEDIEFDYYHFSRQNYLHTYGWAHITTTYLYDSVDNQLGYFSNLKGTPVYLKDMVLTVTQSTFDAPYNNVLSQHGVSAKAGATPNRIFSESREHTPIQIGDSHFITLYYTWLGAVTSVLEGRSVTITGVLEESIVIPVVEDASGGFHQMCYRAVSNKSKRWYSSYKAGAGYIPELDNAYKKSYDNLGSFFPIIHFRSNNAAVHSNTTSKEYKSSVKMLKYFQIEYDDIAKSINANKEVAHVQQAFIMMGVPAVTSNKIEREYLFDFFNLLYLAKIVELGETPYLDVIAEYSGSLGSNKQLSKIPAISLMIQDQLFKMGLNCSEIKRAVIAGSIGKVGEFGSSLEWEEIINQTGAGGKATTTHVGKHVYKKQVTESTYIQITVYALSLTYYIHSAYNTVGIGDAPSLLIPLDYSITTSYSAKKREQLYARSLHLVINTRRVQVVKWYQKLLGNVLKAIAVVLLVYSLGQAAHGAYALAAAGASLSAVAIYVATTLGTYLLDSLIITETSKVIVSSFGADAAMVFAIIAAIYVGNKIYQNSGNTSALTSADKLLVAGSVGVTNASAKHYMDGISKIASEMQEFSKVADGKIKSIEAAEKLLERDNVVSTILVWGETPNNFYNRTIHSGNIGTIGFDEVNHYVEIALSLPKIYHTVDV